jgi:CTP-dependent riboflavin kinase
LFPGSLNLEVQAGVVERLGSEVPLIEEDPQDVKYPPPYEWLPSIRGGYAYYRASATAKGRIQNALVRRGRSNPLPGRVELFAPVNLRLLLEIADGEQIEVIVGSDVWAPKA